MLKRILKNGWNNFTRQASLSFGNTFAIFLAIIVAVGLFMFHGLINYAIEEVENQVDISLFFKEEVSKEDIDAFAEKIKEREDVKNVVFVSKEQAYESFVKNHEDDIYIEALKIIEVNPFLPSIRITANQPSQYMAISEFIDSYEDGEDMIYKMDDFRREEAIAKIENLSKNVRTLGFALIIFLSFLAFLTTFNTVRLTIFSQRKEIEVMKLVGASNSFIRWPYIIQGIMCGIVAAVLSSISIFLILYVANDSLKDVLMGFNVYEYYLSNIWAIVLGQIIIASFLALVSSYIAITKYLKK
ncbi:MAG TPA: permease-like cell division protein FtsX [Candidatus Pacearchaeota archaeon]|nr:permease-like cell division protein FtsX [Candidatus Pacearchaeota archaeon]